MKKEQRVEDKTAENITILGRRERRNPQRSQKNGQKNRVQRVWCHGKEGSRAWQQIRQTKCKPGVQEVRAKSFFNDEKGIAGFGKESLRGESSSQKVRNVRHEWEVRSEPGAQTQNPSWGSSKHWPSFLPLTPQSKAACRLCPPSSVSSMCSVPGTGEK